MVDSDPAQTRAEGRRPRGSHRVGLQAALVELLGDEAADVGVQPVRLLEEEPPVGGDRRHPAEEVLEHGGFAAGRMGSLQDLAELLRVADEHEVSGAGSHREGVCERHLAGLVDEEVVEHAVVLPVGKQPRRAADQVAVMAVVVGEDVADTVPLVLGFAVVAARLLRPPEHDAELRGALLDFGEQLVDCAVTGGGNSDAFAGSDQPDDQTP